MPRKRARPVSASRAPATAPQAVATTTLCRCSDMLLLAGPYPGPGSRPKPVVFGRRGAEQKQCLLDVFRGKDGGIVGDVGREEGAACGDGIPVSRGDGHMR